MSVKKVVNGELVDEGEQELEAEVNETEADQTKVDETEVEETATEEVEGTEDEGDEEEETPLWLTEETEDDDSSSESDSVPVAKHIDLKRKLKGALKESNEELEALRKENAKLRQQSFTEVEKPVRPKVDDFSTTAEFDIALDGYEQELVKFNAKVIQRTAEQSAKQEAYSKKLAIDVDSHYSRAEELVKKAKIEPEVFQQADLQVKRAIEELYPEKGEATFNHLVSMVGEGSEKVALYLGRNKKALKGFTDALREDTSGLKAMLYVGKLTERINGNVSKTSRAPKPNKQLKSGGPTMRASAALKKYNEAHSKGNGSQAYQIKKDAKAAGVDTSKW